MSLRIMGAANKKACTLYYSAVVTNRAQRERKLSLLNPATTKRALRVAEALQFHNKRCFVISPGILLRTGGNGHWFRPVCQRIGCVPVITISQWAVKFVGYLLTPFTAIAAARKISRKRHIDTVVQYCYFPDAVAFSLWCKLAYGSRIVLDLEDICEPRLRDWMPSSETKPLLQLWGWCLMKLSIALSHRVIILSHKFADVVPERKIILLPGCQRVKGATAAQKADGKVNVLMSGGITFENGMGVLADAIKGIATPADNFRLWVCGSGKVAWLQEQLSDINNVEIQFFGFLSNQEFEEMYRQVDVCLALQNPEGRHARFKSPSKGFEAICSGKALIVSDIGDFGTLPDDICYHLRPYKAETLISILKGLTRKSVDDVRRKSYTFALAHYDIPVVRAKLMEALGSV